jgi:Protein of unknown function (DUF541)
MKTLAVAAAISVIALGAIGVLGVAGAETTTSTTPASVPLRTVSVQGVASAPVAPEANGATATAVYRQAMANAVADGQSKAQFLAEKAGATLGAVQSIAEGGGYIECPSGEEYSGEQPDFGYVNGGGIVAGASAPAIAGPRTPSVRKPAVKRPKKRRKPKAKAAAAAVCTLSTQVTLAYQLG